MENILERVQRVDPKKIAWDKTVEEVESNPRVIKIYGQNKKKQHNNITMVAIVDIEKEVVDPY